MIEGTSVSDALDRTLDSRHDEATDACMTELARDSITPSEASRYWAVLAFGRLLQGNHARGISAAESSLETALTTVDPGARLYAGAAMCLATAIAGPGADPARDTGFDALWDARGLLASLEPDDYAVVDYLIIEAAMSSGRLREAQVLASEFDLRLDLGSRAVRAMAKIALARSLIFQGKVAEATDACHRAIAASEASASSTILALAHSVLAYTLAQGNHAAEVERESFIVAELVTEPSSYPGIGSWVLSAFALAAVGSASRASSLLLGAAGGPGLKRLQAVDRAYGYEILATDAIERGDLRAARSWGRRSVPLEIHDMAAAAVERTLSRIDMALGDLESAADRAEVSSARALIAGGKLDAARSRVLLGSAFAASGDRDGAVSEFTEAAADAEELGALAIRSWSSRELRRLGRQLRPTAGAGWASLSEREHQIALLAAEGFSNRAIGLALYLSERTVQSHLSRVLAALGASSRSGLPSAMDQNEHPADVQALTARQCEVAELVADGLANRAIADRLGISEKTVEKHVQGIFDRWSVTSRTGVARQVMAVRGKSAAVAG